VRKHSQKILHTYIPRIHQLEAKTASCKQERQDLVELFSKLMGLWNELDNYIKILTCLCGAAEKMLKMIKDDKVHQFLTGLDDESY